MDIGFISRFIHPAPYFSNMDPKLVEQSMRPKMTSEAAEIFKESVKYILTEWPSLNLAIENGMGGPQAQEKRDWMCQVIVESLVKEKDIDVDEFLGEIINQEFDTLIEDGSLEYNSLWINKFYKDCLQGKQQEVKDAITNAALKKLSLGNTRIPAPVCQTQDSSEDEELDDYDDDEDD